MSIMRRNPFTNEWILYANNRNNRPYEFVSKMEVATESNKNCPFCKHEDGKVTPEFVYQDQEDWNICAFPNLFPIVNQEHEAIEEELFYKTQDGFGYHEVLVDTPNHTQTIDQFSIQQIEDVLKALQKRYISLAHHPESDYIQIFKNCGAAAGMSIRHSHWQIVSLPVVPQKIQTMKKKMKKEDCLMCEILSYEQEKKSRIIGENADFIALTPYASRTPYEVWICPKKHIATYCTMTAENLNYLAELLSQTLGKLVQIKEDIGYNLCFLDGGLEGENFHWHLEILPRIGGIAGFELATDCFINAIFPEDAKKIYDAYQ